MGKKSRKEEQMAVFENPFQSKKIDKVWVTMAAGVIGFAVTLIFLRETLFFQTAAVIFIMIATLPFVIVQYMQFKKAREVEEYLPDFLRDTAESIKAGMPIPKAIEAASYGHYGALSKTMKVTAAQISWGVPLEDALLDFARKIKSKMVRQTVLIIIESHTSGGEIADILETVSTDIKQLQMIETQRKSKIRVYLISIYFIFFLFLGIIIALTVTFIPATPDLSAAAGVLGGSATNMGEEDFKNFFFNLCMIEAFFAGIIGGQMGEGNIIAGFKHSVILVVITMIVFQFFITTPNFQTKIAETILKGGSVETGGVKVIYTLRGGTTSLEVADTLKEIAESRKKAGFEDMLPGQIKFFAQDCTPCSAGDLVVTEDSVVVKRPTRIAYSVSRSEINYRVLISDA
ncbi:MAG: type II secretion system F family protein [Candidatus Micrarchaeota archaeon]